MSENEQIVGEQQQLENQETIPHGITQVEEPAQSPVDRVTTPKQKVKDPKKVAAGRAGAAARKAKQEQLLEQLRTAKETFRPPAGEASMPPPKEAVSKGPGYNRGGCCTATTNWAPWIIGACLTGGAIAFLRHTQISQVAPASAAVGPVDCAPKLVACCKATTQQDKPPGARQLKVGDPFHME